MDEIEIYADGACSGNPGTMGIGVYMKYKTHEKRISKNIGYGTNNIAELTAIKEALSCVKNKNIPIKIYTDSQYSQRVITRAYRASSNIEIIESIRALMNNFKTIEICWIRGHSGNMGNEIANNLAEKASKNR